MKFDIINYSIVTSRMGQGVKEPRLDGNILKIPTGSDGLLSLPPTGGELKRSQRSSKLEGSKIAKCEASKRTFKCSKRDTVHHLTSLDDS